MKKRKAGKKKNIFDIIGMSFRKWWYNFIIVLPFVFNAVASIIGILILFLIFGLLFMVIFGLSPLGLLGDLVLLGQLEGVIPDFSPGILIYLALVFIVMILVLELIKAYFYSGGIAMASEIVRGKKTSLRVMDKNGWKFLWRFWIIEIIIALGVIIWLFIFALPFIFTQDISLLSIMGISVIPMMFVYVFFILVEYFLVLEDLSVWKSFERGISIVKTNYWAMLGLGVLFLLMTGLASFIPWIGGIASLIIFIPCQTIAFVIFALKRAYRR
ncbi:MAG: hypothetical protein IB618_00190 [Candidatus Pacearchaeota archaeon]|nr:MAG: hypothetical protein IB618_00190 [Candidatus Pacearchaeota archaeon]